MNYIKLYLLPFRNKQTAQLGYWPCYVVEDNNMTYCYVQLVVVETNMLNMESVKKLSSGSYPNPIKGFLHTQQLRIKREQVYAHASCEGEFVFGPSPPRNTIQIIGIQDEGMMYFPLTALEFDFGLGNPINMFIVSSNDDDLKVKGVSQLFHFLKQ